MISIHFSSKHLSNILNTARSYVAVRSLSSFYSKQYLFEPNYCNKPDLKSEPYNVHYDFNIFSRQKFLKMLDSPHGSNMSTTSSPSRPGQVHADQRNKVEVMPSFRGIELPDENRKLPFLDKVPHPTPGLKARKMPKHLELIRGEEEVHKDFLYGQYGIVALRGGFLRHGHIEMIRMGISRKIDTKKAFAIWRVEAPWKSNTKKGIGKRMGGGKGNISFYTTPVKAKRVIVEVAGKCTFQEVEPMLKIVAHKLPFPAAVMTQEMIEEERKEEERLEKENLNPYTFKYVLQNNMLGFDIYAKKHWDHKYFGKYE